MNLLWAPCIIVGFKAVCSLMNPHKGEVNFDYSDKLIPIIINYNWIEIIALKLETNTWNNVFTCIRMCV